MDAIIMSANIIIVLRRRCKMPDTETIIKEALKSLVEKIKSEGSDGFIREGDDYKVSWDEVLEWIEKQKCNNCMYLRFYENEMEKLIVSNQEDEEMQDEDSN
jgi:hypothetical protein